MTSSRSRHLLRAVAVVGALVAVFVGSTAAPAAAHGLGGLTPSNYETVVQSVSPRVAGLHARVTDLGTKVQITNSGPHEVVVLGNEGEPYLRVGPAGVFENTRSPTTYLNRSITITRAPPARADAKADPVWRRISSGNRASFHDHRAHFMGSDDPPTVARDPDQRHVVSNFEIPMLAGRERVVMRGQIVYVPPPSPWPWVAGAVALAALVFALSRTRAWRTVFAVTLALLTTAEVLHVIGLWNASTASVGTKLWESAYSLAGIALALLALGWMWRRGAESAVPLVLVASIFLFFAGGLSDVTVLGNSQIPSSLPAGLARCTVTVMLGLGSGLALAAGFRLRPSPVSPPPPRRRSTTPVTS